MKIQSSALIFFLTGSLHPEHLNLVASCTAAMSPNAFGVTHSSSHLPNTMAFSSMRQAVIDIRGGSQSADSSSTAATTSSTDNIVTQEDDEDQEDKVESSVTSAMKKEEEQGNQEEEEKSLEDRVYAAMAKLGLTPPTMEENEVDSVLQQDNIHSNSNGNSNGQPNCNNGVCEISQPSSSSLSPSSLSSTLPSPDNKESFQEMKVRLAKEMNVDETIVQAALGATLQVGVEPEEQRLNEAAARQMIQYEIDAIEKVMEDSQEVQQLVAEGHDLVLSRRALAFADMDIDVARAILIADEEDAKEEEEQMAKLQAERDEEEKRAKLREEAQQRKYEESNMKTVNVDANFDPTKPKMEAAASDVSQGVPKPGKKEEVVFQGTATNIQKLVLESPVPVLLDVYADWCGPCKALTPALEQMAIKAGGMFRLVKLNTDEERNISASLEVTSLPTVFGIRDGKIVHTFKGMPRDEEFMRNFMMGLLTGGGFNPAPTKEEKQKYVELSNKLIKIAGSSGFSFSQRERLQVLTNNKLDELVQVRGDMSDAEESAKVVRSLLSNVIRDPFEEKFRKVNLENKIISERVSAFAPAMSILKAVGFKEDNDSVTNTLILGKGKKIVNVAPLVVARDTIDKWIDINRRAIAASLRKKQDEEAHQRLLEQAEEVDSDGDDEEDESHPLNPNICNLKIRLEGKKKIHDVQLNADDTLKSIMESLPMNIPQEEEVTITCTARRLIVKSTDADAMGKTLREHKLLPTASIVIKVGGGVDRTDSTVSLKERAAARKGKKKGEHTMQSAGIYAKDDNAKGELIDGGGGVWYEHDVSSDDEADTKDEENASSTQDKDANQE